jgi:hypothetical protein
MTASPAPGTPQTALKAHVAGILTVLVTMGMQYLSGRLGVQVDPSGAMVQHGVGLAQAAVESLAAGGVAWLGAYWPANRPK